MFDIDRYLVVYGIYHFLINFSSGMGREEAYESYGSETTMKTPGMLSTQTPAAKMKMNMKMQLASSKQC